LLVCVLSHETGIAHSHLMRPSAPHRVPLVGVVLQRATTARKFPVRARHDPDIGTYSCPNHNMRSSAFSGTLRVPACQFIDFSPRFIAQSQSVLPHGGVPPLSRVRLLPCGVLSHPGVTFPPSPGWFAQQWTTVARTTEASYPLPLPHAAADILMIVHRGLPLRSASVSPLRYVPLEPTRIEYREVPTKTACPSFLPPSPGPLAPLPPRSFSPLLSFPVRKDRSY